MYEWGESLNFSQPRVVEVMKVSLYNKEKSCCSKNISKIACF